MAIFHFTVKIVGRSKGKSIIAASAYLNGDVMKNEETGKISYYTSKKEVVYTSLMMCENVPPEWMNVPDENIKRFQKSIRYQSAEDKEAALEKFKITFRKQRLWNEVLKAEKGANAQLGRSFEFSLPKEWNRKEQIEYASDFIQRNFVAKGMCADWSIHDKGDGNPHVHLLVTMRPFKKNHTWGNKEVKDWAFVRDKDGNIVMDETHPDWWQDKKNPERHGIRIPVLDADGKQKMDSRNRKQWKREVTDATGWNNPKNCELWRSEWAKECNQHLKKENQIDHRSYERQGKIEIPTIHEGADARKIEEKYQSGQVVSASWKVEENRMIKKQNVILKKLQEAFRQISILLKQWKGRLYDIRRKQRGHSHDGDYDKPDRGAAGDYGGDVPRDGAEGRTAYFASGAESKIAGIKRRVASAASNLAKYRGTVGTIGEEGWRNTETEKRKSAMERISGEVERREPVIAETERGIAEIQKRLEKVRDVDERIKRLKARRADGGTAGVIGEHGEGSSTERYHYPAEGQRDTNTAGATERIAELMREAEQREQSRERTSLKDRIEANKRIVAEREREKEKSRQHDKGMSR
ncbi:MAG: MobA/MobL family protein [Lachnospiraceae bacterium]|nr:MobA/MobL family protein [Lachnospiraceae bacterium]